MQSYELMTLPANMPGKLCLYKLVSISGHRHSNVEILFILSGTVKAFITNRTFILKPSDIIVINALERHELFSENAEMISLEIRLADFSYLNQYKDYIFNCCSALHTGSGDYDSLKGLFAQLVKESTSGHVLGTLNAITAFFQELIAHFTVSQKELPVLRNETAQTLDKLTGYIYEHYRENIHMGELAHIFHFSQPSLSRFFKNHLGISFSEYYNGIRLEKAADALLTSTKSLADIAFDSGFPNVRSMNTLFKKKYDIAPGEYRKVHSGFLPKTKTMNEVNYLAVTSSSSLSTLAQYLKPPPVTSSSGQILPKRINIGVIDTSVPGMRLRHTWRTVCCVGSVRELLSDEVARVLRRIQNEIPYKYIIFHGILSDDLMIYDELSDGKPVLSFTLLDKVLDFLQSIGLKPVIQFSFMPSALASDPKKTNFFMKYNTSLPKNYEHWDFLIESFVRHCVSRYRADEVQTWPFCLWNEPDTTPQMFGFDDQKAFFKLYERTYKIVKNILPSVHFGTPSLMFLPDDPLDWYRPFFEYCHKYSVCPDFLNIHYYDDDLVLDKNYPVGNVLNRLSLDTNSFAKYIQEMYSRLNTYGIEHLPVYMTEWNLTVNQRNLINDTCFKSCYLAKNLLENYDALESFGYWSVSDFVNEIQLSGDLFHGGLGMFTINGVPKPIYYAFRLIAQLSQEKIGSGDGWFATKSPDNQSIKIILYNYSHYNKLLASGELFDINLENRYTPFSDLQPCQVCVTFTHLNPGTYRIIESFINREHGSCYDSWINMGAPKNIYPKDTDWLKAISVPGRLVHEVQTSDGQLPYQCILQPLEVRLVEITAV